MANLILIHLSLSTSVLHRQSAYPPTVQRRACPFLLSLFFPFGFFVLEERGEREEEEEGRRGREEGGGDVEMCRVV